MARSSEVLLLARTRRLLASGYVREVRESNGLTLRQCAEAVGGISHVGLLRWERGTVPRRQTEAATRYVALIERVARGETA